MQGVFRRLQIILGHMFKPFPQWGDMWQKIITLIIILVPPLAGLNNWLISLRNGLRGSAILVILLLLLAAYRIQTELDEVRASVPNLILKRFTHRDAAIHDLRGKQYGTPTFYHLAIINKPTGIIDRKTAEKVAGRVVILDSLGKPLCEERLHRWAHAPSQVEAGKSADMMQAMDIAPNGIEFLLDIAMKYDCDNEFYTTNNDTGVQYSDFRDPSFKFGKGEYVARISLSGNNVNRTIDCRIVNLGRGKKLHLEQMTA